MKVSLDHITIRTHQLTASKDFFIKVFDLKEGERPELIQRIPGHWLYAGDRPIVHLIATRGISQEFQAEAIDHVGIRLEGYAGFLKKLQSLGIRYSLMDLPEINERRIFFKAPGGQLIEAVFEEKIGQAYY